MKRKRRKVLLILLSVLILLLAAVGADMLLSIKGLSVTEVEVSSERIDAPLTIVQLTDLHDSLFGEHNSRLIGKVEEQSPDLILITGDLINCKTGENTSVAEELIRSLCEIAPVYISYGNQEISLEDSTGCDFTDIYSAAGATVLKESWIDIDVNGQELRLGGIYGYCLPEKYAQEVHRDAESAYLKAFQDTDRYKILLCHIPVSWIYGMSGYDWDVDLVFGGHIHGGQIRFPFIGGLWAPDVGWFPGDACGVYQTDPDEWKHVFEDLKSYCEDKMDNSYYSDDRSYHETICVVSRGLGNTEKIPRFNNIPEVMRIQI